MPTIFAKDAEDHACPYNEFRACLGPRCMAWVWEGPRADRCETDNLVETEEGLRPIGAPKTPEGDGWEMDGGTFSRGYRRSAKDKLPPATAQRRVRQRECTQGRCVRSGGDGWF